MTQPQPFTPDDVYCVYCHAAASGPCAVCGALCCGECVELVMALTQYRAVCRACMEKGWRPAGAMTVIRIAAPVIGLLVIGLVLFAVLAA